MPKLVLAIPRRSRPFSDTWYDTDVHFTAEEVGAALNTLEAPAPKPLSLVAPLTLRIPILITQKEINEAHGILAFDAFSMLLRKLKDAYPAALTSHLTQEIARDAERKALAAARTALANAPAIEPYG